MQQYQQLSAVSESHMECRLFSFQFLILCMVSVSNNISTRNAKLSLSGSERSALDRVPKASKSACTSLTVPMEVRGIMCSVG